jgi:hypothetical protein
MRSKVLVAVVMFGSLVGCAADDGAPSRLESALTVGECTVNDPGSKDAICHWGDTQYVLITVADAACVNAHAANHPQDFLPDTVGGNGCSCVSEGQGVQSVGCCPGTIPLGGVCEVATTLACKTFFEANPNLDMPASCKEYQDLACKTLIEVDSNLVDMPASCKEYQDLACKTYIEVNPGLIMPASCKEYQISICNSIAAENPNSTLPVACGGGTLQP